MNNDIVNKYELRYINDYSRTIINININNDIVNIYI